jgi:hypothetical protein
MDAFQILAPLIGVVLGSALTGFGAFLRARGERKRVIATALADLLEVRHQVVGVHVGIRSLLGQLKAPTEVIPHVLNFVDSLGPANEALHERFEVAVATLASVDPMLAYMVRAKNTLPRIFGTLRSYAIANGADLTAYDRFESDLMTVALPTLNDAVLELARHHSWRTSRKVRSLVSQPSVIPAELVSLLQTSMSQFPSATAPVRTESEMPNPSQGHSTKLTSV